MKMKTVKITEEAYAIILDMLRFNYMETKRDREQQELFLDVPVISEYGREYDEKHLEELKQTEAEAFRLYKEFQGK